MNARRGVSKFYTPRLYHVSTKIRNGELMDIENNLILINNILAWGANNYNFRKGTQTVEFFEGVYTLKGQNRYDNRVVAFDFNPDGTPLGIYREIDE